MATGAGGRPLVLGGIAVRAHPRRADRVHPMRAAGERGRVRAVARAAIGQNPVVTLDARALKVVVDVFV